MTTTLIHQQKQYPTKTSMKIRTTTKTTTVTATARKSVSETMAWSTEKLRFSCVDNIGLKQLWKLIALDATTTTGVAAKKINKKNIKQLLNIEREQRIITQNNNNKSNNKNNNKEMLLENCEHFTGFLANRDEILSPSRMSFLKFLAINALELSAPATLALLQKNQNQTLIIRNVNNQTKPHGWMQLSGHPESIVLTSSGIVRKRIASITDSEVLAYQQISQELQTSQIVPQFYGTLELNDGSNFVELQDLLAGFKDPCVMDIKMGCRTFLESEVKNKTLRPDLYQKMMAVDPNAPTAEEHEAKAITKLRYMLFRESMSSSQTKGFRIEALRLRGREPLKDLKKVRTNDQIMQTIEQFLNTRRGVTKELIQQLKYMRHSMEESQFFQTHEIIGSSIFIVYDDAKIGAWLIDFAKSQQLPAEMKINHRDNWVPGNREDGLFRGMDELINVFEDVNENHT